MIGHIAQVQPLAAAVARIDDLLQFLAALDNGIVAGQRAVAEMIDRADLFVGLDNPLGQARQLFLSVENQKP